MNLQVTEKEAHGYSYFETVQSHYHQIDLQFNERFWITFLCEIDENRNGEIEINIAYGLGESWEAFDVKDSYKELIQSEIEELVNDCPEQFVENREIHQPYEPGLYDSINLSRI